VSYFRRENFRLIPIRQIPFIAGSLKPSLFQAYTYIDVWLDRRVRITHLIEVEFPKESSNADSDAGLPQIHSLFYLSIQILLTIPILCACL
jgi:hypothetical protein